MRLRCNLVQIRIRRSANDLKIRDWATTSTSNANSCLSEGGLLPLPGYTKSRSSPSKLLVRRNLIEEFTNCWRLEAVESMAVIVAVPIDEPPTASRVFKRGLLAFRLLTRWYLKKRQSRLLIARSGSLCLRTLLDSFIITRKIIG